MDTTTTYPVTEYPINCPRTLEQAKQFVIVNALKLMQQHGLYGWTFSITNSRTTLGHIWYDKKAIEVSITNIWVNPWAQVRNTILHEIAHALAHKQGHSGHDHVWRRIAISIGCDGERLSPMPAPKKYIATCHNCGRTSSRSRKGNVACGSCCRKYNKGHFTERFLLRWQENTITIPTVNRVLYRA
jgi:predicted SprT family Zn-dependent metalloprotease